jgi:protein-L-isoaspartate(D-aspartate) O-methyltransferase
MPAGGRAAPAGDPYALKRRRMVEELVVARGVREPRVVEALLRVPRHLFVDEALGAKAYGDHSLPIGFGQTISQPYTVARMSELLEIAPGHRVLEVGTGSGYQTAVLALLARHVYTVERLRPLGEAARRNLRRAGILNVSLKLADGSIGWEDRGPFERILVTAGGPEVPRALVDQLQPGGVLVMPIGGEERQRLVVVRRGEDGSIRTDDGGRCAFVKLVGKQGWRSS